MVRAAGPNPTGGPALPRVPAGARTRTLVARTLVARALAAASAMLALAGPAAAASLDAGAADGTGATADPPSRCELGEYGEPLSDGSVDVGCDGRMSLSEQGGGTVVRLSAAAPPGREVAVVVDARRLGGRIVEVERLTNRGARVEGLGDAVRWVGPADLVGVDVFAAWWWDGEVAREVRVEVDVERRTGAGSAAPPIGRFEDGAPDAPVPPVDGPDLGGVTVPVGLAVGLPLGGLVAWAVVRRGRRGAADR